MQLLSVDIYVHSKLHFLRRQVNEWHEFYNRKSSPSAAKQHLYYSYCQNGRYRRNTKTHTTGSHNAVASKVIFPFLSPSLARKYLEEEKQIKSF